MSTALRVILLTAGLWNLPQLPAPAGNRCARPQAAPAGPSGALDELAIPTAALDGRREPHLDPDALRLAAAHSCLEKPAGGGLWRSPLAFPQLPQAPLLRADRNSGEDHFGRPGRGQFGRPLTKSLS